MNPDQPKNPNEIKPNAESGHEITKEEQEMIDAWLELHPIPDVTKDPEVERLERVKELESLLERFETEHDLSALNAITELDPKDAPNHPIREPARLALVQIVKLLELVKLDPSVSESQKTELESKYKKLSRAVGIINSGQVNHVR